MKRHSSGERKRWAIGASQRLPAMASRVGMAGSLPVSQSASQVFDRFAMRGSYTFRFATEGADIDPAPN